jgi:hypothetical protein
MIMEIIQKRLSNRATFVFGERELRYTIKDSSGSRSFSVEYGAIPDDVNELEERNVWYRNVGIFWVALGILQIGLRFTEQGELKGSIWLTLGVLCFLAYALAKTKYSTIPTEKGTIFIIKNKQHDAVMNELTQRRKNQWRQWYGEVNLSNDPAKELGKLMWLKEREAITETEYRDAVSQITQHHNLPNEGAPVALGRKLN